MLMNHKKIIQYISILIISVIFLFLSEIIFIISISFFKGPDDFILEYKVYILGIIYIIYVIYFIRGIPFILRRLDLQPRNDLLKLLSSINYKQIRYYKLIIIILKFFNISVVPVLLITAGIVTINLIMQISASEIWEFILINPNFTPLIIILIAAFLLITSFVFLVFFFFYLTGDLDASGIPISFICEAIKEIDQFEFSSTWEEKQLKRNRISNLMNNALEFIAIQQKNFGIPFFLKYNQPFIKELENEFSLKEISFRINGLTKNLNEIIIDLNYVNTIEEKEKISKNLIEFLNILQNRNLQEMERVEYNQIGIIERNMKKIKIYYELMFIVVGFATLKDVFGL